MKYRHYAPKAQLSIVDGELADVYEAIRTLTEQAMSEGKRVEKHGDVAKHLYQILREFDETQVDVIFSEPFTHAGIGSAVNNRLEKAAGHHHILASQRKSPLV